MAASEEGCQAGCNCLGCIVQIAIVGAVVWGAIQLVSLNQTVTDLETTVDRLEDTKELLLDELGEDASIVYKYSHERQNLIVEFSDIMADQNSDDLEYVGPKLIRKIEWNE